MDGQTKLYGIIGDPVEHSLSPVIQNAAFEHLKLNCVYVTFHVKQAELKSAINGIRSLKIQGFNVTMPHKTNILPLIDEVEKTAAKIGAVNTVKNINGRLIGYNTDGVGALKALEKNGINLSGKKIVILGAGGAGRAISYALAQIVDELVILNRTELKAQKLANELCGESKATISYGQLKDESLRRALKDADVIINATSVGMYPCENETPINNRLLNADITVFDLVYSPLKTRLLKEAETRNAKTLNGLHLLVHQGAESFKIWTALDAPLDVMWKALTYTLNISRVQAS
ncbi:shikimate dehydrogenase [Candidatus Bathyarchaeota archaeon]|nr:shikimate dehydrogenase [Candidatus Bathyarchaeota archaeon]